MGRETLMQSAYFCQRIGATLAIYISRHTKFLMYFEHDVVQVDMDKSYLKRPETARERASHIAGEMGLLPLFVEPKNFTASTLPDIPATFDFMSCPEAISHLASRIGLGHIGLRVPGIVSSARFPVLITRPVYKPWRSIAVFFGGSANAINALKLGFRLKTTSQMTLNVYTQLENRLEEYKKWIQEAHLEKEFQGLVQQWFFFDTVSFEDTLYEVPHDAMLVVGAYGHGVIHDLVFGSKMEKIQSTVTNSFLIVGPKYLVREQSA
jgi:hypothetical protein